MKDLAKNALLGSGLLRLASVFQPTGAAILMYHSVLDDPSKQSNPLGGIGHSSSVFRRQMELLAREFHPLSMGELSTLLRSEEKIPQRSVVVTFDDGYRDNFENAMPILDRAGVPAIFYVTVDCIEMRRLPWPSRVRFALHNTGHESWQDPADTVWPLTSQAARDRAFARACELCCRLSGESQDRLVGRIEAELDCALAIDAEPRMMTWEEVRKLKAQGHEIGSHTLSHPNVAQIPIEEARIEFERSRAGLEKEIGEPVKHFSYPCPALTPHWNSQTVEACRQAGYETAVVTDGGLARKHDDPLCLRRVRPSKTLEGLQWNLEWAFAGRAM